MAGTQSDTSNGMNTASESLPSGSGTASCQKPQSLAMSEHSSLKGTPKHIREWLMLSQQDSHVSRSVLPASVGLKTTRETCGLPQLNAFASYDPNTHSWRTSQDSLFSHISDEFSETWPRQGMTRHGKLYPLRFWVPRLYENASLLLPGPTAAMGKRGWGISLTGRERYSTVRIKNAMSFGYKPHPQILEWAMGWPATWSGLEPLATARFQQWYEQFGNY